MDGDTVRRKVAGEQIDGSRLGRAPLAQAHARGPAPGPDSSRGRAPDPVAAVAAGGGTGRTPLRTAVGTMLVGASAFFMGLIALWQGAYMSHVTMTRATQEWDGGWYYGISKTGYVSALPRLKRQRPELRPAFFPGLPLLERGTHDVLGGSPARTILFLGAVALIASCLLFRALVAEMFDDAVAWRATLLFAFFPGAYVFLIGYSELLEIPVSILALLALRRRQYLLAGFAALVATGTRLLGVAVLVALVIAALREVAEARSAHTPERSRVIAAVASPFIGAAGLVGYMAFLYAKTGDALAFTLAERVGWHNTISLVEPFHALHAALLQPLDHPGQTVDAAGALICGAGLIYLVVRGWRRLRVEEIAYASILLASWLFTSATGAWFRFVLAAFPLIALVAARVDRRFVPVLACASAMLFAALVVLFASMVHAFAP